MGETGSGHVISWRRAGGGRTGCETAVRPHDQNRRHSDLISRQCRIVSKWRGILAPRRTFKSTVGRRTDDLSPTLRKKKGNRLCSRVASVSPSHFRRLSPVRRSKSPPLSLFLSFSLSPPRDFAEKINELVARGLDNHESRND